MELNTRDSPDCPGPTDIKTIWANELENCNIKDKLEEARRILETSLENHRAQNYEIPLQEFFRRRISQLYSASTNIKAFREALFALGVTQSAEPDELFNKSPRYQFQFLYDMIFKKGAILPLLLAWKRSENIGLIDMVITENNEGRGPIIRVENVVKNTTVIVRKGYTGESEFDGPIVSEKDALISKKTKYINEPTAENCCCSCIPACDKWCPEKACENFNLVQVIFGSPF